MACVSGRPSLSQDVDRSLFAESAGTCLLCNTTLFPADPKRKRSISIAERAHIVAHSDDGPRANLETSQAFRDDPANIVLLCPNCHTKIDKAPESYPVEFLIKAKKARQQAISHIGGTASFSTRSDARKAAVRILLRNAMCFKAKGPDSETGSIESRERAAVWSDCVLNEIVPNNRLLVALVEVNEDLATSEEIETAELLRQHTDALESKHRGDPLLGPAPRFPEQTASLFMEE
ncbi:HNH endonuclease [Streptomyces griseofuscus]|uniref:HNH endonuclease n=1 Tax=Streptomyces griseofuscus TaxID=146922 RepID=UPI000F64D1A7|nr:HNH endonuclease [Streptomyces griseofuscus]